MVKAAAKLGSSTLKSPFLCVNSQLAGAFGQQSEKRKNGARKSLDEKLSVLESFRRLREPPDKRLYRLVLDYGLALVWHLQSPVEDLSVL